VNQSGAVADLGRDCARQSRDNLAAAGILRLTMRNHCTYKSRIRINAATFADCDASSARGEINGSANCRAVFVYARDKKNHREFLS
jgi:hypothetical protein